MSTHRFISVLLLISALLVGSCQSSKRALRLLEKRDFVKAEKKLTKALEKDSLSVAAHYGYSLLFSDSLFARYHIDSAHYFVQQAQADYQVLEAPDRKKLSKKLAVDSLRLVSQHLRIDSLAFVKAAYDSSLSSYQYFIDHYPAAPQQPEAIRRRNQLAFAIARQRNTYKGYKAFMDIYPQAEQYSLAEERYNTLVFQAKTQAGNLASYRNFLQTFPDSPYRPQAEKAILEISTADNALRHYARFARQYPDSPSARRAVDFLYHLYQTYYDPQRFLQDFPGLPFADSLRRVMAQEPVMLSPVLQDARYGFLDSRGRMIVAPQYDAIPEVYRCEGVLTDYLHAATRQGASVRHDILSKQGEMVFSFDTNLDEPLPPLEKIVIDLGSGLLWITQGEQQTVIHQSGYTVISAFEGVTAVELLPSAVADSATLRTPLQFLKYQANGQWGLKSWLGKTLLEPRYDDIEAYESFIVLEQDGLLAVTNREAIIGIADQQAFQPEFIYEDVALLDNDYLIGYQGDQETVLDTQLQTVVPLAEHRIVRHLKSSSLDTWLLGRTVTTVYVRHDSLFNEPRPVYTLYNPKQPNVVATLYDQAYYNDRWLTLKSDDQFLLIDYTQDASVPALYDSVKLVSEFALVFYQMDSMAVLGASAPDASAPSMVVPNTTVSDTITSGNQAQPYTIDLTQQSASDLNVRLLQVNSTQPLLPTREEYLLINTGGAFSSIINSSGKAILEAVLDDAQVYPGGILAVERRGRWGLIDSTGQTLLPPRYDAIGHYEEPGMVNLLEDEQFGWYDISSQATIAPQYESILTRYAPASPDSAAQSYLVAQQAGRYGIINTRNEVVAPLVFQQVLYWNDTSVLAQADGRWLLYRLADSIPPTLSEPILYDSIADFTVLLEEESEQLLRIYQNQAYGVMSNRRGLVVPPIYDGITFWHNEVGQQTYLAENYDPRSRLYTVFYLNARGKVLRRQIMTIGEYDQLYCSD